MKLKRNWKQLSIPIGWHGDGIACIASGKNYSKVFDINSWASILANGSSLDVKMYCFGVMKDNINDEQSLFLCGGGSCGRCIGLSKASGRPTMKMVANTRKELLKAIKLAAFSPEDIS